MSRKFPLQKVAISVFDRWLGRENLHMLDCRDAAEREDRNIRMLSLWMSIYDTYDVLCRNASGEFVRIEDRSRYQSQFTCDGDKSSDEFQCILVPELTAIYYENWDDTNVLWCHDRTRVNPILDMARTHGLHAIEFTPSHNNALDRSGDAS